LITLDRAYFLGQHQWMTSKIFAALMVPLFFLGCSNGKPVKHKRDEAFFANLINPSDKYGQAAQKLNELKTLHSNQKYTMRYALFDNGKFYYEIENLGHGEGKWSYKDGYLNLYAVRTMFDMDINLLATEETGSALGMQFLDRFGHNIVKVDVREPQ